MSVTDEKMPKPDHAAGSQTQAPERSRALRLALALLPLAIFVALAGIFLAQLLSGRNPQDIPSALIGTQAPSLDLPALEGLTRDGVAIGALNDAAIEGRLALVNVWASWCVPCRQEHPFLMELAGDQRVSVVGINYKDAPENAISFLDELGNPFAAVGVDQSGRTAIDWGVYGVPETYLVAPDGTILYKHVGPFSPESYRNDLVPAIERAASSP